LPNFLETNGGVTWVGLEQLEFLIGKFADLIRQLADNNARTLAPRNASKWRAAAGFEILICPFPSGIEAPGTDVSFDLPIPLVSYEFVEPLAETGELHCGKVRNSRLEILDAHPTKKLSAKLGIANPPYPAHALTLTSSLLKVSSVTGAYSNRPVNRAGESISRSKS
jgi:hypothetical protein